MVNKLPGVKQFRAINEIWIQKIPWPNINPSIFTVLQVVPAIVAALYFHNLSLVFWMLVLMLFFDLADGAIAKKHKRTSKFGYYMDLMFDRLTETIIFLPLLNWWLILAVLNSLFSILSIKKNIHVSIPLRQAYGVYLLFVVFF
jgi:phosphatidylglycerophosphate synthase